MRRDLVVTLAVCVLLGLAASELLSYLPVVACLLLLAGAFAFPRAGRSGLLLYGLVLLTVLYGQYRYWHVAPDDVSHFAGARVVLTATVAELPAVERDRAVFRAEARSVSVGGRTVPVSGTVRVSRYGDGPAPAYGDRFTATAALRPVTSLRNPGGFDYAAHLWRQGVRVRATISRRAAWQVTPATPGPLTAVHAWRARIGDLAGDALSPASAALVKALVTGDGRAVPEDVRTRFQAAGLAHLLAVSGTHLGLVAGLVFLLARWALWLVPGGWLAGVTARVSARQAAGIAALLAVTAYALLAGARTPTLRALVMVWMVMSALLLGRRAHTPTALALAALVVLGLDPRAVGEASFQLSFAAVLAILLVMAQLRAPAPGQGPPTRGKRLRSALEGAVAVTLAAGLATAPLAAWHFGQVAWPGFLANLLLVPVTGAVVLPACLLAAVSAPALGFLPVPGLLEGVLSAFLGAVGAFAALPGALARVPAPPLPLLAATYAVGLLLWLGWRHAGPKAAGIGAAVLVPAWLVCLHPAPPAGALRVALLDAGQGDAAVVVGPTGDALVIDGGTRFGRFDVGRLAVAPYLRGLGVRRVALLATHPQLDHAGGLIHLIGAFRPGAVYTNGTHNPGTALEADFRAALAAGGLAPVVLHRGSPFAPLAGVRAEVLGPPGPGRTVALRGLNDTSLVVRLGYGRHAFLFTGDIGARAEAALVASGQDLSATVLKVPHHGAGGSSTAAFLARVAPHLAVISAGRFNPYHHPSPAVVAAYRSQGVPLYATPRQGAVLMVSDGTTLKAATWADLAPARVPPWSPAPAAAESRNLIRLLRPASLWRPVT